ncbi:hypothetical protein SLA2020_327370 [Shorea laevis]
MLESATLMGEDQLCDVVVCLGGEMIGEVPNVKKWIVFYPVVINSKKTVAEGRRIGLSKSCENPTCAEIGDCCGYL